MPTWISLGAFADVDPTEGNRLSENAADFLGTYDNTQLSFVTASATDANGDGLVSENDLGNGEIVTVEGISSTFDSIQSYNVTITTSDGTVLTGTAGVAQLTNGQAYVIPSDNLSLDGLNIRSIQLTSINIDDYDGMWVTSASRSITDSSVVCFASGTMIETDRGARPVETLKVGDLVLTLDHGLQHLRWIGSSHLRTDDRTRPIRIARHALGIGYPQHDLLVSPQHRILVRSRIAKRIFGEAEVLIAAKKLLGVPGVAQAPQHVQVTYWHVLFDTHEIVFANGTPAESLYTGPMALAALDAKAREDVLRIDPCLNVSGYTPRRVREFATGGPLQALLARHEKHRKPLFDQSCQ